MPKIRDPRAFSAAFGIPESELKAFGVFDPILSADTPLFIDPLLLEDSSTPELVQAAQTYRAFFDKLMRLLAASKREGDPAWVAARKMLSFHEFSGTCLGYGAGTINGSGWGPELTDRLFRTAKEVVDIGTMDPDLFLALSVFEKDIGPDRISDMTTNIIRQDLIALNIRIAAALRVSTANYNFQGNVIRLPRNPLHPKGIPVILVPRDVLRALPIALDWDGVIAAAQHNANLRDRVNTHLGDNWAKSTSAKAALREKILGSAVALKTWLDAIKSAGLPPYDYSSDPDGLIRWVTVASSISGIYPKSITKPNSKDLISLRLTVNEIIEQFRFLIEQRDLWKEMWIGAKHRTEKTAQRLFFAVAYSYCNAANVDITPEAETGNGPVDFKFSAGKNPKIAVELKLSSGAVESGYNRQLPKYMAAEEADAGIFIVLDVGSLGNKLRRIQADRVALVQASSPAPTIEYIDCQPRPSASKL